MRVIALDQLHERSISRPQQWPSARAALTLVEVVISTLLVSTLMVTSLTTSLAMTRSYFSMTDNSKSILLAERYLTEVLQSNYEDAVAPTFGLETGEGSSTREDFDDVDDYNERLESPPTSRSGVALPGYETPWSVSIAVATVNLSDPRSLIAFDTGLKRIEVTVTNPQGSTTTLSGLRSKSGGKDLPLKKPASYAQWIGLSLQTEGASEVLHAGTEPLNLSEVP